MTLSAKPAVSVLLAALISFNPASAETPDEWVKLGTRVHGGFGSFIPLGIRIGLDAVQKLKLEPRQLSVTYYDNKNAPCACFADGIAISTLASVGQRSLIIALDPAPQDKAAVVIIRPRNGGYGYKYSIPMSALPILTKMNTTLDPLSRYHEVMNAGGLFEIEPIE